MTTQRTKAILEVLRQGGEDEVERRVLQVFGASSIEECAATYEMLGSAERSPLDDAVSGAAAHGSATFLNSVEAEDFVQVANAEARKEERASLPDDVGVVEQARSDKQTYWVRRRLVALGRSYWVEDAAGVRVYGIAGKVRFARTFAIKDAGGNLLYSVREKLLSIDQTYIVSRDGLEAAVVKRTTTSGATVDKYEIALQSGEVLFASGKLWRDEGVQVVRGATSIAIVRRQLRILREVFLASLLPSADQALWLAIAMAIVETDSTRGSD